MSNRTLVGLILISSVLAITACGEPSSVPEDPASKAPVTPLSADELDQVQILAEDNICTECHGMDLEGTENGPGLAGIGQHWTEAQLVKYIYNPEFYMVSHPEVRERNTAYENDMPPYTHLTEEERRLLARWVLQQGE